MSPLYLALLLFSGRQFVHRNPQNSYSEYVLEGGADPPLPERSRRRDKRGLLELAGVIKCSTGRSAVAYIMYGCYCGLGGQGWPRDKADWCCHKHDCCYEKAEAISCQTKTDKYQWTCENRVADCESLKDRCERILCRCDRDAARCLRKAPFIPKYAIWPDFLCGFEHPTCAYY